MYESYTQSRKWLLTINNPQDHGMSHNEIIDRAQKFNPDYMCLAEHRLEKLSVRIDGHQQMEQPEGFVDVEFTDLVVTGYESQGKLQFTAKASGIFLVD